MRTSDPALMPRHVGIIMDGNGRWARMRNLPRSAGHKEGLNAAKSIVKAASENGIEFLTLYTFSTENWKRAKEEVSFLMRLIRLHLRNEWNFYRENKIRVVHSGDMERLPPGIQREIRTVVEDTRPFEGMILNLAINYGGRDEIIRGVNRWLLQSAQNDGPAPRLTEEILESCLDCPDLPAADLIVRTGGEQRISNFLLWQSAYSELYFSEKLWPDFGPEDLVEAVEVFQKRTRRYGATPEESGDPR
ncbi:MAG TPA: polyprenyl diphosphate synthase [Spirochaetia bacterium]|nr:polyprenyl diphosphate synthase [Spirochaetia bacterium]